VRAARSSLPVPNGTCPFFARPAGAAPPAFATIMATTFGEIVVIKRSGKEAANRFQLTQDCVFGR